MQFDPIFDCTVAPIHELATWIWEGRGSLSRLQKAWRALEPKMSQQASWAIARGPLAAVWISLCRIGWDMAAAHLLVTDQRDTISLLHSSPSDVRQLVWQGIQRWQMRRVVAHLPEYSEGSIWHRALRQAFFSKDGVRGGQAAGALRCLWAGASWPRSRKHEKGMAQDSTCLACGEEADTNGHRWCRCNTMGDMFQDEFENEEEDGPRSWQGKLRKGRRSMKEAGALGDVSLVTEYGPRCFLPSQSPHQRTLLC